MIVGKRAEKPCLPVSGDRESGALSPYAFLLLAVMSAMAIASAVILTMVSARTAGTAETARLEGTLVTQSERLASLLSADPTPASDSPIDPVWHHLRSDAWDGCGMTLEDVSSRINPNWVQRNFLSETDLGAYLFKPGRTADELQAYRVEGGFHRNAGAGFSDFFHDEAIGEYLTTYGYANVNTTDEFSLEDIAYIRTGERDSAMAFHARVRDAVSAGELMDAPGLREALGPAFGRVYPVVNTEPSYNVHFLPEKILRSVFEYPAFAVPDPANRTAYLVSVRGSSELTEEALAEATGIEPPHRIYGYLGVTTWFWAITAKKDGLTLCTVLARLPGPDGKEKSERPRFRIVEKRISK